MAWGMCDKLDFECIFSLPLYEEELEGVWEIVILTPPSLPLVKGGENNSLDWEYLVKIWFRRIISMPGAKRFRPGNQLSCWRVVVGQLAT